MLLFLYFYSIYCMVKCTSLIILTKKKIPREKFRVTICFNKCLNSCETFFPLSSCISSYTWTIFTHQKVILRWNVYHTLELLNSCIKSIAWSATNALRIVLKSNLKWVSKLYKNWPFLSRKIHYIVQLQCWIHKTIGFNLWVLKNVQFDLAVTVHLMHIRLQPMYTNKSKMMNF